CSGLLNCRLTPFAFVCVWWGVGGCSLSSGNLSTTVYSDQGSIRYSLEVTDMNNFQDFLQEIEDCDDGQLTVPKVMQWLTGQAHKPVLPSEKRDFDVSIQFKHDCDGHAICFPTVSACSRTVTLPVLHMSTIQQFRNIMEMALTHGG
ncbi:hypothetical protein AALO_G00284330, partial [Alosa alosa]